MKKDHEDASVSGEETDIARHPSFYGADENELCIFSEPPTVDVTKGNIEDSWPTKYVEYEIKLKYRDFKWTIYLPRKKLYGLWFYVKSKGYLHKSTSEVTATASPRRDSIHAALPQLRKLFLSNAERSVSPDMLLLVKQYLEYVLSVPRLLSSARVMSLLQVSASTFDEEGGYTSIKEGWVTLRMWGKGTEEQVQFSRGNLGCDNPCFNCFCVVKKVKLRSKHWRWAALKPSCIAFYSSVVDTSPHEVLLFDSTTSVHRGVSRVGSSTRFVISNSAFVAEIECGDKSTVRKWASTIREAIESSQWARHHRDESFAMPRSPAEVTSRAKWFVDGKDYYEEAYNVLLAAKKEIFIAGWWICPNIYLLRPPEEHPESRLDNILLKKAQEGVQIYVQMYKEVTVALTLNSLYSKKVLRSVHPNVHVIRDPDFIVKQLGMWSHHEKIVCVDQKIAFVGGLDLCFGRWDTHEHTLTDYAEPITFPGKDFSNPRIKDFVDVENPDDDLMDREKFPRMPWHDVHCVVEGQPARDVARHFIQRWNFTIFSRGKLKKQPSLLPRPDYLSHKRQLSPRAKFRKAAAFVKTARRFTKDDKADSNRGFGNLKSIAERLGQSTAHLPKSPRHEIAPKDLNFNMYGIEGSIPCECQVLRSVSSWSAGCKSETSIQNAYIRLIGEAKHFVYIENQFFVSGQEGDINCSNRIANAIVNRIRRAAANKEAFRVMVVMPLLPAFPGKPEAKEAYSLRGVMHWQYRTICRGEKSIYERLYEEIEDPFEYIAFFGLRTHSTLKDKSPVTEEIYIHSKTMIVDDSRVIIGSANINERSMNGDRDSEIAVVLEDTEMIRMSQNGVEGQVGSFGHSYRMKLFEEHFGVTPDTAEYDELKDPIPLDSWFRIQEQALLNSNIYEAVFRCLPSDSILSFKEMGVGREKTNDREQRFRNSISDRIAKRAERKGRYNGTDRETDEVESPVTTEGSKLDLLSPGDDTSGLGNALTSNLQDATAIKEHMAELSNIRGHLVYFPLNFLANEELEPKLYPAELFQ